MTLAEFKAWFSGFTESMDSTPNEKQWARIKERVAEIDDKPVTYPVYIDRYVRPYVQPWQPYWVSNPGSMLCGATTNAAHDGTISAAANTILDKAAGWGMAQSEDDFNSHAAMLDLGKAEYQGMQ